MGARVRAATSGLTALVFGIVPALLASPVNLASSVKEGGYATLAPARERLRDAFIVAQIALGLVLANGAMLLVRSYAALRGQDFGFATKGVITMSLSRQARATRTTQPGSSRSWCDAASGSPSGAS